MSDNPSHARTRNEPSMWAVGTSVFAASVMLVVGILQFFQGLVAIVDGNDFLLTTPNYVFQFDADQWGWIHLVWGVVVALAGLFIFTGNVVARGVGIVIAGLSAIANFLWIPYYPIWGIALVALNVLVIWALSTSNLGKV